MKKIYLNFLILLLVGCVRYIPFKNLVKMDNLMNLNSYELDSLYMADQTSNKPKFSKYECHFLIQRSSYREEYEYEKGIIVESFYNRQQHKKSEELSECRRNWEHLQLKDSITIGILKYKNANLGTGTNSSSFVIGMFNNDTIGIAFKGKYDDYKFKLNNKITFYRTLRDDISIPTFIFDKEKDYLECKIKKVYYGELHEKALDEGQFIIR